MLTLVMFCNVGFSQNLDVIEKELQEVLNQKNDELVSVSIVLKSQINSAKLHSRAEKHLDKSARREFVIDELKEFSLKTQADVLSYLQAEEKSGKVSGISSLWIVNAISCDASKDVIYKLSSHPDVAIIGYDKQIQLLENDDMMDIKAQQTRGLGHHIISVNADDVWNQGFTGKNVIVAVLDSGTNIYHKDLRNRLWTGEKDGQEIHGWNFATKETAGDSDIHDEFGHGTHCAGIVCGDGTLGTNSGVAPDALLMTVKVVGRAGTGSVQQMLSGVQFAVENGANILSMSLGFKNNQLKEGEKEIIRSTFDNVLGAGVIVCAAAGNDGTSSGVPDNVDYPAACPSPWSHPDQTLKGGLSSVVCVGADDLIGQSSQGPSTWEGTSYNDYPYNGGASMGLIRPDISAPGNLVMSANYNDIDAYKLMSGTSQATPCVAGVMALMLEKNPNLTPAQICEIIETTAANKPESKNNVVGSGRIDALAAIKSIEPQNQKPYIKFVSYSPKSAIQGSNVDLSVTVQNVGKNATSANATATLETDSPYVTINSTSATIGTLDADETTTLTFSVNVSSQTPNNHNAFFTVKATDNGMSWSDNLSVNVSSCPEIVFSSVTPGGINAGEEADITVTMQNKGNGVMPVNTNLKLMTTTNATQYVTLLDDEATIAPLNVNETANATFKVMVSEEVDHGASVDLFIETTSNVEVVSNVTYEFENDMEGWTTFDARNYGTYYNPYFHSNESFSHGKTPKHSHSGNGHMMSETEYHSQSIEIAEPIDNYFVSPKIKVASGGKVSFWARAHHVDYFAEHFGVAVSTSSNNNAGDFEMLSEWTRVKSEGVVWKKYEVDLSKYSGQEIYVAIRHFFSEKQWENLLYGYNVNALNIDDVTFQNVYENYNHTPSLNSDDPTHFSLLVSNTIELPAPTGVTAVAEGYDKVNLSWNAVARAKGYSIYRNGEKIASVDKDALAYSDNNLTHNTTYCYEIAAVYAGVDCAHSESVCATTVQKDYSAAVKEFSPQMFDVDGETNIAMSMTIINDGKYAFKARSSYSLTCDDNTYVVITNNTGNVKLLQPNEEIGITATVKVSENIPNNYVVNFNLNLLSLITDPSQPEYFTFDIPFDVPVNNPLRAPKNVAAKNIGSNSVTLGWDAVSKATSYNVYRDGELVSNTTSTLFFDNNLEKETMYCYKVTSVAASEESDFSQELCVTTLQEDKGVLVQSYDLIEQGATTIIKAVLINNSDAETSETATATLTCEDEYVTIVDGMADLASLAVGETATVEFSVKISNSVPAEHNVAFNIIVETEGEDLGNLEYTFDSGLDGWTNYIWAENPNWKWEYDSGRKCITSYSYKNGNRKPDNLICSPVKIKVSENTQIIWDVAASGTNYYEEKYGVYLTEIDPVSTHGWATAALASSIFEKTLTSEYASYKFKTETASASSYTGKEVWLVFRHFDCTGQDRILVDNIKITNVFVPSPVYYYNMINITANPPSPVELTAIADGANKVDLSWSEDAKAESYNIYRDGEYLVNTTLTSYSDNNLTHNTTYCYEVTAVNEGSEYAHSGDVCVTTTKMDYNVIVEFATQTIDVEGETTAAISFTVLNDGRYDFEASYTLTCDDNTYVSIANNVDYINVSPEEEVTKTINVTISENVPDDYVFDFNLNLLSLVTDSSQPGYFTFDFPFEVVANNPLRIPENLTVTDIGLYSIALEWDAAIGAASYNVYRDGEFVANTNETNYLDENLNPETRYCYKVTNVTSYAESDFSEEVCATTLEEEKGILVQSCNLSVGVGQATLSVTLINRSESATAATTTASISCEDQYVTIVNPTDVLGSFAVGETATAEFSVILDENIPSGYNLDFEIAVEYESDGGGYTSVSCTFDSDLDGCTTLTKDDHNWYHSSNQSAHGYNKTYNTTPSGMGFIFSESYCNKASGFNPDHLIILPEQVVASSTTKIEFYACSMSSSKKYADETFGVFVSTTNNTSIDSFEEVNKWTFPASNNSLEMAKKTADLANYEGEKIWIAIRHYGDGDNAAIAIDDITVNNVKVSSTVTYTDSFSVTVNSSSAVNMYSGIGSWTDESNWSFGSLPTAEEDVVINGDVTIENGDITVKSLTINNEKSLTVNEGVKLTVVSKFVSPSVSSLIINDGAQICQTSENVPATFMMKIEKPDAWAEANKTGWQFISSPLKNSEFESFIPETGDYDLYMFDGSKEKEWVNYKSSAASFGTDFEQGRAYMVSYETEEIAVFTGYLNHEKSFTFDIPYQYEGGEFKDFFLLGNPFTFDISWADVEATGMNDDYAYIKKDGNYGYATPTSTIKVGDGFFVKALADIGTNTPSVTINLEAKRKKEDVSFINIIAKGKEGTDNVVINFAGNEKEGFPKLENFNDKIANVYVAENDSRYGIYNYDSNVTEIPVCFEAKQMGTYSISIETEGEFEDIVLVDMFTGEEVRMLFDSEYKFTATNNDNFNRFVIKIVNRIEKSDIFAHQNGEELIIDAEGTIQIIDIMGRMLYNNDVESSNNRIDVSNLKGSTYILRNISDNNGIRIQKIVIL